MFRSSVYLLPYYDGKSNKTVQAITPVVGECVRRLLSTLRLLYRLVFIILAKTFFYTLSGLIIAVFDSWYRI